MDEGEKSNWKSGTFSKSTKYGYKIHFAPGSYQTKASDKPVVFQIPKLVLVEMYENKQLEINTYEYIGPGMGIGIPKLGMEYELVVFGPEGIAKLQPYISSALD